MAGSFQVVFIMIATGYIDGVIAPLEDTRVPVLDRGFLYGDSIYEVFRTYSGIPFMFDEHYTRLQNSARLCGMHLDQSREDIYDAARQTVAACQNADGEDVYIRYQITRGEGPVDLYPDPDLETRLIIIVKPVPQWNPEHYRTGMSMAIPSVRRNSVTSLDPNIKGGNYLNNVLALAEARHLGMDECLMLDAEGNLSECSNSNIWLVIDDKVVTPVSGNLVGLTRRSLMSLMHNSGQAAEETMIHSDDLSRATECFVTSATREVMPVNMLRLENGETLRFPDGGGEKTKLAQKLYQDMLVEFVHDNRANAWF